MRQEYLTPQELSQFLFLDYYKVGVIRLPQGEELVTLQIRSTRPRQGHPGETETLEARLAIAPELAEKLGAELK